MKEYTYEVEQTWEKQRRPVSHVESRQRHQQRHSTGEDAAMDADASSMSGTYRALVCYSHDSVFI